MEIHMKIKRRVFSTKFILKILNYDDSAWLSRWIKSKFALMVIRWDPLLKTLEKKGRSKQKSDKKKE